MCSPPTPIYKLSKRVIKHIVNQRFDLVDTEVKKIQKKGYIVHSGIISKEEYNSSNFTLLAGKIIKDAKDKSKRWKYNGLLVFCPIVNSKNYQTLFEPYYQATYSKIWENIFQWSKYFNNGMCLGKFVFNQSLLPCEDTNIYVMVFYFKGGLNWK